MAHHDELLDQAVELAGKDLSVVTQADLRRSVSTAYYAVFHLLTTESVAHWDVPSSRPSLARMFEHSVMKRVSNRIADPKQNPFVNENATTVQKLRRLAKIFVQLQEKRHVADYDNATYWTQSEALVEVESAMDAFDLWNDLRHTKIAQDYLVSLLIKPRE